MLKPNPIAKRSISILLTGTLCASLCAPFAYADSDAADEVAIQSGETAIELDDADEGAADQLDMDAALDLEGGATAPSDSDGEKPFDSSQAISVTLPLEPIGEDGTADEDQPAPAAPEDEGEDAEEDLQPIWSWPQIEGGWLAPDGTTVVSDAVRKGVDISQHQGLVNWELVKEQGIDFAILRCGFGLDLRENDDTRFAYNVAECERLGIPYGVYLYSYAASVEAASSEADHAIRLLEGHTPDLPVYYDLEESDLGSIENRELFANMAETFCTKVQDAGYDPGVYASLNWWNNYLVSPKFNQWERWVAQYNNSCAYAGTYSVWQASSRMPLAGISSETVDVNFDLADLYRDVDMSRQFAQEGSMDFALSLGTFTHAQRAFDFAPDAQLTYGEAIDSLYAIAGRPMVDMGSAFWAKEMGLVKSEEEFAQIAPNPCLREDLVQMMAKCTKANGISLTSASSLLKSKADWEIVSKEARAAFGWALDAGIMNTIPVGALQTIQPKVGITRADAAHALFAYYNMLVANLS